MLTAGTWRSPHDRPVHSDGADMLASRTRVVNAMTVDVEDFFQVTAFERHVRRETWDGIESRVCANTIRLLEMFRESNVTATFFVLGWVADRFPGLLRQIAAGGHEIASHGYGHRLVYDQTPGQFAEDLRRASDAIHRACGVRVVGYRAPSYSIVKDSMWALDVLLAEGYLYDASIFPIHHDRYGIPDCPRHPHPIVRAGGVIWEFPGSTVRWGTHNLPTGGGGYFRLLPYEWTRRTMRHVNTVEKQPAIFYIHPWEIDPDQPRIRASALSQFRHYRNLARTEPRLRRLLSEFAFAPVNSVLSTSMSAAAVAALSTPALLGFGQARASN